MEKEKLKKNLLDFIQKGTSSFTCIKEIKKILQENDYIELEETDAWQIKEGKYFIVRNDASCIAFQIPKKQTSFHIITTHSDTPALLLKPNGDYWKEKYLKYNIMPYGGLLNYGWLDHPLSLAGRIYIEKDHTLEKKIVDLHNITAVIPSVAIHQNDKANTNLDLNMQLDLQPIFAIDDQKSTFETLLKQELKLGKNEKISDFDFFLYNKTQPFTFGFHDDLLLSPRIDNLTSVSASLESFLESTPKDIAVFCTFNNEEIGSLTKEGAESSFLLDTLKKIAASLELDITSTLAKSFIISSDNTHAVHPNHPEFKDDTGSCYFNEGFAIIKEISSTTDSSFSSLLKSICKEHNIAYQNGTQKNDLTGGSTLSGLSLRHVSVTSIDVGIPELAMHSSMEVCSFNDYYSLYQMMKLFYNTSITIEKGKIKWS